MYNKFYLNKIYTIYFILHVKTATRVTHACGVLCQASNEYSELDSLRPNLLTYTIK